jgi:hypothetical protein
MDLNFQLYIVYIINVGYFLNYFLIMQICFVIMLVPLKSHKLNNLQRELSFLRKLLYHFHILFKHLMDSILVEILKNVFLLLNNFGEKWEIK